jgi:5-methylcytosine-specific restriction protein A
VRLRRVCNHVRREFPGKVKAEAFKRCGGVCEDCTAKLFPGNVEYDHIIPDSLGGEPTLANCRVKCRACHKAKSAEDAGNLARSLRREANHIGARAPSRNPIPGGRRTPWKMTFGRGAIRR